MTERKYDLMAVGLTTLDISVRPVRTLPEPDAGVLVETICLTPAGTAGGTALVAATLGLSAAVVSAVGDDAQGGLVRALFDAAGVDTAHLATMQGMPTSTTVLPIREDGQRPNLHMLGASMMAGPPPAAWGALGGVAAVHWGGVGLPGPRERGPDFLRAARDAGAFVTCDLIAPSDESRADLESLLPHVDLFMPSLAEVRFLTGTDDPEAAAVVFIAKGAGGCLFKLGAEGALLITPDERVHVPAFAITPIDTTSCGDAFCAGFHAARRRGLPVEEGVRFASATAACVALGVGTTGALRNFEATLDFARSAPVRA